MKEQIKGFNKAYQKIKELGFENYFCLTQTTWKQVYENFEKGLFLTEELSIFQLQENVNIVLSLKDNKLPYCTKCKQLFSPQEFKAGFKECEHCSGDCGCKAVLKELSK